MKIPLLPTNTAYDRIPKFVSGETLAISQLYGKLESVNLPYTEDFRVKQQFITNLGKISSVVSPQDGSLWMHDADSRVFERVNPEGNVLAVISHFDMYANNMTLLPSGDLLLSVNTPSLKLVKSGSLEINDSLYSSSPLSTSSVHVTATNKVIIGAREIDPTRPAAAQVIVMDQTGQQEKVFQYGRHSNPLFTYPARITSNSISNIAVIDRVDHDPIGRVVVMHLGGTIINIYDGNPKVNCENNPFKPLGIVSTPSDNFVVTDVPNHTLHILNNEGDFITYYKTKEIGIELPMSLAFSSTGQLYIGCCTYKDSKDPAKLVVVDNFVW